MPQSLADDELAFQILRDFQECDTYRSTYAQQWEEVAQLVLPDSRNTFYRGSYNWPGQKKTERQIDASGMMALSRFAAICDSLLTPRNMMWHMLGADTPYLAKDRQVKLWFEEATRILFKMRYAPKANFVSQNQQNFQSLGAFGNGIMFTDKISDGQGLRYRSCPMGEIYFRENHQGMVDTVIRAFRMTARQAKQMWPDTFPEALEAALEKNSEAPYDFVHRVMPQSDFDPDRLDVKGKPFRSDYMSITGMAILQKGGYTSFPYAVGRYTQAPGEVYGRGPAMMVLPALKTLNAQKRVHLKAGHRGADPVLLTPDDGLMSFSLKPGAMNPGGMTNDGKALVGVLPSGNIQISEKMMEEEKSLINDAFLVTLFQVLTETPQMTATEVIERVNEKGILLAPTVGRQQSEMLGPMIERELDLLAQQHLLPPMPPLLREAGGSYHVTYTSPLSRAMRAQDAAGFMRSVEGVKEIVAITQDVSLLDRFDFDTAIPEIAEINGVPESWIASDESIAQKRANRAKAAQQQQQVQAMPAQAAMMKAQAVQQQAGMQPQQQPGQPQQ